MDTCKICGSKNVINYKHPTFDMLFHECRDCEVIYKDEKNRISLKDELDVYNLHENTIDNIGYVNYLSNFVDATLASRLKTGHILDFGSGPNPVLKYILETKYNYKVDIYDYFYHEDEAVFKSKYDAITSTEVFEHLWEPKEILDKLYSSLKPNGILAIMTLFHPKDQIEFFDWFYIRDPSHVTFYTPKTFEMLGKMYGFTVIDTNHYRYITLKKISRND